MSKKILLLALAAISAVMFALPAIASAGTWSVDPAGGKFPVSFTLASAAGTTTTLTTDGSSLKVTCSGSTGSGKQVSATKAEEVTLTFTSCKESLFGSSCTSSGQASGSVKTTDLTAENVKLEASPLVRGVLLKPPSTGHFASFSCGGGLVSVVVTGTGIMGEVTSPACGTKTTKSSLKFESPTTGTQKWTQVTTEGTKFDLSSSENGGAARTASQDGEGTVTFAEEMTFTC